MSEVGGVAVGRAGSGGEGPSGPPGSYEVDSYAELHDHFRAFAEGKLGRFVIVIGAGGVGKSEAAKRFVPEARTFGGHCTAFEFYRGCFSARNRPIVLDDMERGFWRDAKELLKALTDSRPERTLRWDSAKVGDDVPKEFATTSPTLVLCNRWESLDADVRALETRAEAIVVFRPTAYEVHCEVARGDWFNDESVYDYMYELISHRPVPNPNFRMYVRGAAQRRSFPRRWQSRMIEIVYGSRRMAEVAALLGDGQYKSNKARAAAFAAAGHGSIRTFYRLASEFPRWRPAAKDGPNPMLIKPKYGPVEKPR